MYRGAVERLFNVGHTHDPVAETRGLIIGLSLCGAVLVVYGIIFLVDYIIRSKKK